MTDDEIIASMHAGDRSAFPLLYQRYAGRGVRYAYTLLKNSSDAEEAVQEVFCKLLTPLRSGDVDPARGGFSAIFFKSLRNLCIDMLRKSGLERRQLKKAAHSKAAPPADHLASQDDLERKVRQAIEALPSLLGDAFKLRLNGRLSYEEIAQILDCSRAQVRTWIYRARRRLEADLVKEGLIEG